MIRRNLYKDVQNHLVKDEITVITGPRQSGKTTLMRQLSADLQKKGNNILFFNLDYQTDMEYFSSHDKLLAKLRLEFGEAAGYLFIDEIQRLRDAGLFLKGLYDLPVQHKIIVSGSGSLELKEHIKESLAGRKREFHLLPVSFHEFADYETEYKYSNRLADFFAVEKAKYMQLLPDYMCYGGYPRIITERHYQERLPLMDEIFSSYAEKDLTWLLGLKEPGKVVNLIRLLAARTGQLLNYSELASQCGIRVVVLKEYLYYLEQTFSIDLLKPFYGNKTKELTKSQIPYFLDNGLRNFALGIFGGELNQNDAGFLFQNVVYNRLSEMLKGRGWEIKYWRTTDKAEVDFVIDKHSGQIPVEAKFKSLQRPEVTRSLRSFIKKYKPETALIVTIDSEEDLQENGTLIKIIPFYKLSDGVF